MCDPIEPEDISSYTIKDLEQLLELNKQAIAHYEKLLDDPTMPEDSLFEIRICIREIKKDIKELEEELVKRKKNE